MNCLTAKLLNPLTAKPENRFTAKLVNRLTASLMNRMTAKLVDCLTAKLVVVNLVKHVLQRIILARNSVVDIIASRARKVQDKTPFPRLVAFGDDPETAHVEDREGRLREGARHPACLNFGLQVIVNYLRV